MAEERFFDSFAEAADGLLLIANGLDPMQRWDGLAAALVNAGMTPPASAPTLAGSGTGVIVGTYYAYVRWVDNLANVSDLSPISTALTTSSSTGNITAATNATPIAITSGSHGLSTGATVLVGGVGSNTAANGIWVITVIDANTFSLNGSSGVATYTGGGTWSAGIATITYTNVPVPTDTKVQRRQILRNTAGQAAVFYVDVDTTDLASTTFTSTRSDNNLSAQVSQAILDQDGNPLANLHAAPPAHKAVLAQINGRMFAAVEHAYTAGNVQVANGSATVTGIGTAWTSSLVGRYLYAIGATQSYQIQSVNTTAQTLTLAANYADTTDNFALYAIRPAPAESRLVYYTEAGLPESWPVINAISIQADADEMTGLMVQSTWLYILERRHIYRLTFHEGPATDGAVFLVAQRGCVNQRCCVLVDANAYLLDEQGIYAFDGDGADPVSEPIQLIFQPQAGGFYQINWAARDYFHAVHYPVQSTIRWFVALAGERFPRHALAYQYRTKRWWIEEFMAPIAASCFGTIAGIPQVFLGSDAGQVLAYWRGSLDGPNAAAGTVRGNVASATFISITDTSATFASSGLVGAPVAIIDGTGKGQVRRVTAVAGQTLTVDQPWQIQPDTTSMYQLGAIPWLYRSGWFRWTQDEAYNERRAEVVFATTPNPATMDLRLYLDFSDTPLSWGMDVLSADGDGISAATNNPDLEVDLTKLTGFVQKRFGSKREFYLDGPRFVQLGLRGFGGQDPQSVYEMTLDGAAKE